MSVKTRKGKLALGAFLILVGIVLLLHNLGIIPVNLPGYILSWKSLLVVLGIFFAIIEKDKTAGIVLATVGFYFLIPDIWDINPREAGLFWPILFMAVGLSLLLARR
jgi:hypothetical protein